MNDNLIKLVGEDPYLIGKAVGFDKLTELHNEWLKDMIFGVQDKTLLAHRLSYKTTCLSISIALLMVLHPDRSIIFMRKTDGDVSEVVSQVKKILMSPFMQEYVKRLYNVDLFLTTSSSTKVDTNLNASVRGTCQLVGMGVNGSLTGKHAFYVFTDDIVNLKDRSSRAEREHTKAIYQELQNVVEREGRIFNSGTPWHKEDAISVLMPNVERYDCYQTNLIDEKKLQDLRESMLPSLFSANYELKHIAGEDVIFFEPKKGAPMNMCENGMAHVDSAFYGEDYTAFTVMKKHGDKYYVFGKLWRKHVEDCYSDIFKWYDYFLCNKLYNENNADKGMVAKELRKQGMRVVTYHESVNKHIKIVTYLKAIWKDVIFINGTDADYINQICDYTEDAEHDDAPDSCACLARILYKKKDDKNENLLYL